MKLLEERNNEQYYYGVSLTNLAKKYGTPLKITFLDVIKERVANLKASFDKAILEQNYKGKFIYLNANKANYGREEIEAAFLNSDGLETSSYYDLLLSSKLMKLKNRTNDYLVTNGYKPDDYLNAILKVAESGYHIIDIIDSVDEYERIKASNISIEVGLRIHLQSLYPEVPGEIENDRFGLLDDEVDYILSDIKNTNMTLSTIHFHQRGFDYEQGPFQENFEKAFVNYYVKAAKKYESVINFDMGGGTPLPTSGEFDYDTWAKYVIGLLKILSKANDVKEPNLFSENGKYSQKDGTVNIYKVITKKYTNEYPWHIVDGSLLIAMPEAYALGEPINVIPLNELQNPMIKAKLAGVTCDCDDVFPFEEKYIELPKTDNDLYIGLIGTGSYQNSMNGKGGIHHCLLPEEQDVVIENGEEIVRHKLQTIDEIFKTMKLK